MNILFTLTRMWLTRTFKPWRFSSEYNQQLSFADCDNLGLYVHIPFCRSLCAFCPYCKTLYSIELCNQYIDALVQEIHLVGGLYQAKKKVSSLYFGGGTPALAINRLQEIIKAIQEHFIITDGIGIELHPDDVTTSNLLILRKIGVNRISIGIQSFLQKYQQILGRKMVDTSALKTALKNVHFDTVSMDFIFALPGQSYEDLKSDIDSAFDLGANHVAIYPFIDFTFTTSTVPAMANREKRELLDAISQYCLDKGYSRRSIWTFAKDSTADYSSMTRENFLGFGCSATTLLKDQFKINTFDVDSYCKRISERNLATSLTLRFTQRQRMIYWLFWTAYSTKVHSFDFQRFFGMPLKKMYGIELWFAKLFGLVTESNGKYEMTLKGAFYFHYYEKYYTLAYIDKMWGLLRHQPFPKQLVL